MLSRIKAWAHEVNRDGYAIYLASRDPRVPWYAKALAVAVAAYALSPIDLIPDFIPVVGFADDAIFVAIALRSVVKRAGPEAIRRHWPGTADGLASLWRLAGLESSD